MTWLFQTVWTYAIPREVEVEDSEDRRRRQSKSRDIEDG